MGVRRVQKVLNADPHLDYKKLKQATFLTKEQKVNHVKLARLRLREYANWWQRTIFSDENDFSIDAPDGRAHY